MLLAFIGNDMNIRYCQLYKNLFSAYIISINERYCTVVVYIWRLKNS